MKFKKFIETTTTGDVDMTAHSGNVPSDIGTWSKTKKKCPDGMKWDKEKGKCVKEVSELTRFEIKNDVKEVGFNQLKKGDVVWLEITDRTNFEGGRGLKHGMNEFIFDKFSNDFLFLKKDGKTYKFETIGQNLKVYRKNK